MTDFNRLPDSGKNRGKSLDGWSWITKMPEEYLDRLYLVTMIHSIVGNRVVSGVLKKVKIND